MTLDFKILWFDDQPESMKEVEEIIRRRLIRDGFNLVVEWVSRIPNQKEFLRDLQSRQGHDLILLDMNMHDGLTGDVLAKKLRSIIKYTDVLFYSARTAKELRERICAQNIDGVYCCHRDNVRDTAPGIINSLIQKALDVNQMRGITMAKVADFDEKMKECLLAWHGLVGEKDKAGIVADIIKRMSCFHLSGHKSIKKIPDDVNFEELISMFSFSTDLRRRTLEEILKENSSDHATDHQLEIFSRFKAEVIDPRNDLAHVTETKEGGQTVLMANGKRYDKNRLSEVRRGLQEHSENLDSILKTIQRGGLSPTSE